MEDHKKKSGNAGLYVTLIAILLVVAAIVAVSTAIGKRAEENVRNEEKDTAGAIDTLPQEEVPVIKVPETAEHETPDTKVPETEAPETKAPDEDVDKDEKDAMAEDVLPEFQSPVSGVILKENSDTVPVFSDTMNDYRTHAGVDVSAGEGEAVKSAADGVIGAVWEDPMMGTCMTVVHSGSAVSTYKGLNPTLPEGIAPGVTVTGGQVIAAVGTSALLEIAEEPHLHFELTVAGENVDPCLHVSFEGTEQFEG